jgi:hypothetical protein
VDNHVCPHAQRGEGILAEEPLELPSGTASAEGLSKTPWRRQPVDRFLHIQVSATGVEHSGSTRALQGPKRRAGDRVPKQAKVATACDREAYCEWGPR